MKNKLSIFVLKKLVYMFVVFAFLLLGNVSLADHTGDYYDNRDDDHARLNVSFYPGLTYMSSGYGAQMSVVGDKVVVGNASLAVTTGRYWGSLPRAYYMRSQSGMNSAYDLYTHNNAYWYVEHRDHDDVDYYFTQSPTYNLSQGSSGSELDEVGKWFSALDAFGADTKNALIENNLVAPTMQMIARRSRVVNDYDYLTGVAHPNAFANTDNGASMIEMASNMSVNEIPPMVQIAVVEEDYNLENNSANFFEPAFISGEDMSDTPVSITRIFHGREYTKRIVVSAEDSYDINGLPLTYHWSVLRGDASHVRINPLSANNSMVEILIDYHGETNIGGTNRLTNLVSIGVFVNNGHYYSAPAFVTSYTKRNETREYDSLSGRLTKITYNDKEIDPYISATKAWESDTFFYDANNELKGWDRLQDGEVYSFTKEGYFIEAEGTALSATSTKKVIYKTDPNTYQTVWQTIGEPFSYPSLECSWTYTDWSDCNGYTQEREITTVTPTGCNSGEPVLVQGCGTVEDRCVDVTYSDWSDCLNGIATRTAMIVSPEGCAVDSATLERACEATGEPTCTAWSYSDWSDCADQVMTRTVINTFPEGCAGGEPVLSQACEIVDLPVCDSWVFSDWTECSNYLQHRTILNATPPGCEGGDPVLSQVCQYTDALVCESWTYSNWSACDNNEQTRDIINAYPGGCVDGVPLLRQDCRPSKINDLKVIANDYSSLDLQWTSSMGNNSGFDIRYSSNLITESNWEQAKEADGEPISEEAGTLESYSLIGLFPNANYYVAIKTIDAYGNSSLISNVVSTKTSTDEGVPTDRIAPGVPTSMLVEKARGQAKITWENPSDADFVRVRLRRSHEQKNGQNVFTQSRYVYNGNGDEYVDPFLNPEIEYTYSLQSYDRTPNYSKYTISSVIPDAGDLFIDPQDYSALSEDELSLLSLASVSGAIVNRVSLYEAGVVFRYNDFVDLNTEEASLYEAVISLTEVSEENTYSIAYFIHSGTKTTTRLGAGERAGVLHSYFSAFNHLPTSTSDWQDVIKIASGRWPTARNRELEGSMSDEIFSRVYNRNPNINNQNDLSAIMLATYGLLPAIRNLDSEESAIVIYRNIFDRAPTEAFDWNIVRAIAYSGASR